MVRGQAWAVLGGQRKAGQLLVSNMGTSQSQLDQGRAQDGSNQGYRGGESLWLLVWTGLGWAGLVLVAPDRRTRREPKARDQTTNEHLLLLSLFLVLVLVHSRSRTRDLSCSANGRPRSDQWHGQMASDDLRLLAINGRWQCLDHITYTKGNSSWRLTRLYSCEKKLEVQWLPCWLFRREGGARQQHQQYVYPSLQIWMEQ
jgi:hypothetical protein